MEVEYLLAYKKSREFFIRMSVDKIEIGKLGMDQKNPDCVEALEGHGLSYDGTAGE